MRKPLRILLWIVIPVTILAGACLLCGGIHYLKFIRYHPANAATIESESDFRPDIGPTLYGSDRKTIIPLLLYYQSERDGKAAITIETEHENDPRYGYDGIAHVRFDELFVNLPSGEQVLLIEHGKTIVVDLNTERWASRLFDLGFIEAEEMEIVAAGIAIGHDKSESRFRLSRIWEKHRSSRLRIGLSMME